MSLKLCTVGSTALLVSAATAALGQQTGAKASPPLASASAAAPRSAPTAPAASAAAAAPGSASGYKSAFAGYRAYAEQPVQSWRESNDVVGRIGGWQAYAREGQGGPVAGSVDKPVPAATPGKPEMPGMPAGHGGMNMQPPAGSMPAEPRAPAASGTMPSNAPMKMPAPGPKASATPARTPSATPSAAASAAAAAPGAHTGHPKP